MRKAKLFTIFTMLLVSLVMFGTTDVQARTSSLAKTEPNNEFTSTGAGPATDHSYYSYYLDGEQTWCIQAGVSIRNGLNYDDGGRQPGTAALSYIMLSGARNQLKQAAVWQLVGGLGINGSHVINMTQEVQDLINEAQGYCSTHQGATSATISPTSGNMYYDVGSNTYRMDFSASGMPSTSFGYVQDNGGGNYTLIVNAADFDGDMDVTLSLAGSGPQRIYDDITIWVCPGYQTLATPNFHDEAGAGASATFHIEAVGFLKVQKLDDWGQPVAGCVFTATGPSGTKTDLVTGGDGWAQWGPIKIGNYTVTETSVPPNLVLNPTPQTRYVGNGTTRIGIVQIVDNYQRGSVRLTKYDTARRFFNLDKTLGDAKIYDAIYEFYAAEDIYEGPTLRYRANELIKSGIHTDANGGTPEIKNLPIGRYYYKEVEASEGFDLNPELVYATVEYRGMYEANATANEYEHGENPKWYSLEINKRLQKSDYDDEANLSLHDTYHSFEGARFKITLNSDPSQYYYTHGTTIINPNAIGPDDMYAHLSADDGRCIIDKIPYGVYTVEEVEWPIIVTEPVANWMVDFRDDNPEVDENRKVWYTVGKRVIDTSKKVTVEVNKKMVLAPGEDTDAKIEGAYFTIYRDPECKDESAIVDVIGPTNREGYAKLNGYVWAGTYYMKETTFPEGIDPDSPVFVPDEIPDTQRIYPDSPTSGHYEDVTYRDKIYVLEMGPEKQTEELKTYTYDIINVPKRNDIQLWKMIEGSANTERHEFENCVFTAYLKSSIGTDHEFSREVTDPTNSEGWAIIEDLPYGEYIVKETYCPPESMKCSDFTIFIALDRKEKKNPSYYHPTEGVFTHMTQVIDTENGAIVDPIKTIDIKVRKVDANRNPDKDEADYTLGDGVLKGAKYAIYGLDEATNLYTSYVGEITVDKQDNEGYWYGEYKGLAVGSYKVVELAKANNVISYAEGYFIDEKDHYIHSNPEVQKAENVVVTTTSEEKVFYNDLEILKEIQRTSSSEIERLEGAEFTASLISTDNTSYEYKRSAITDKDGYCIIKDLPYGTYKVTETIVPEGATACEPFTIVIDTDRKFKPVPYNPTDSVEAKSGDLLIDPRNNAIIDTAKTMDVKIRKVDSQWNESMAPSYTRGQGNLKDAVYSIYRWSNTTTDYTTYVGDMIVDKVDDEGYWYAEYDGLKLGKYMVVEKAKNEFGESYAEGYTVDTNKYYYEVEDTPETPLHTSITENAELVRLSKEDIIKNKIVINKKAQETANTERKELAGVVYKATLISSLGADGEEVETTKIYYSEPTNEYGYTEIIDLPYGIYEVEEVVVNEETLKGSNFVVNIEKDYQAKPEGYNPVTEANFKGNNQILDTETGSIVDISKKMVIKVDKIDSKKGDLVTDATSGNADLQGAIYEVYKFNELTQKYDIKCEDIVVDQKGRDGYWYAETEALSLGKYKIVEKAKDGEYSYAEGYLVDHEEYFFEQFAVDQEEEISYHEAISREDVVNNDLVIVKKIGETTNTPLTGLSGAQFTATLKDTIGTDNEDKYVSTITDESGYCIIENMPYGEYVVEETTVPVGTFKCSNFTIFIEQDRSDKALPYVVTDGSFDDTNQRIDDTGAIVDTPKIMDIKLRKVDFDRKDTDAPDYTQGEASLQNAIYRVYAQDEQTGAYDIFVDELVITHKDEEGYWCGELTGLKTGNYMAIEKAQENGIYSYAEGYKVDPQPHYFTQNPAEQSTERVTVTDVSNEKVIRNDIEIIKKLGATTNTSIVTLSGCQFTARLVDDPTQEYVSTITDENGHCTIKDLPYGEYEVEETLVAPQALKCSNFTIFIEEDKEIKTEGYVPTEGVFKVTNQEIDIDGGIVDTAKVMNLKIRKTDADRTNEEVDWTQGDAQLVGAKYEIYRYNPETKAYDDYIDTVTIDHKDEDGYWCAEYKEVISGQYMMTEVVASVDKNGVKLSHAKGYKVDEEPHYFESDVEEQTERVVQKTEESKEVVIRGRVDVIKMLDEQHKTEENPAKGAILRLSLQSNPDIYYDVVIDGDGAGVFMDTNDEYHSTSVKTNYGQKYGEFSIPYGTYMITEVRASDLGMHLSYYIYPERNVTVLNQDEIEKRIEWDDGVPVKLKIHKVDAETGEKIPLSGAEFKVWDEKNKKFVSQRIAGSGEYKENFVTNNEGYIQLPGDIEAGYYILYELNAPEGYYLDDKYRLPQNEEDIGNKDIAGLEIAITTRTVGLPDDAQYNENIEVIYDAAVPDRTLMGQLRIYKRGEVFTGVKSSTKEVAGKYYEINTPVYEQRGLANVEFTIYAAEDIYTNDGSLRYSEGTEVDKITTDQDGVAETKELYLGEYRIVETKTPAGYKPDNNINNVVLTNDNQYERVRRHTIYVDNSKQNDELLFNKHFTEEKYFVGDPGVKYAIFGVFTGEDIQSYQGTTLLRKDDLVDVMYVTEGEASITLEVPDGKYYYQELYSSYPYTIESGKFEFEVNHTDNTTSTYRIYGQDVENRYSYGDLYLAKFTTSDFIKENDTTLYTESSSLDEAEEAIGEYIDELNRLVSENEDLEEIQAKIMSDKIAMLSGAEYLIYIDEECTQPLQRYDENGELEEVKIVTDGSMLYKMEGIPIGMYYLKEIKAPTYTNNSGAVYEYEISKDVVQIDVNPQTTSNIVIRALYDVAVKYEIEKVDIFTGDLVPDCLFTIKDEAGKELIKFVTDKEGRSYIPTDIFEDGKYYYFQELEASNPFYYDDEGKLYELDTQPHKFQAHVDEEGRWKLNYIDKDGNITPYEKPVIFNYRPTSTLTLTKLDIMTSEPVPNCKFELRSKETDFVVEGVTDENGIYVFENIPYGEYTYTEIEAPEEYYIDTEPHDITINAEQEKIVVKDLKKPLEPFIDVSTSDIAVGAIAVVMLVSIFGIAFIIRKRAVSNK